MFRILITDRKYVFSLLLIFISIYVLNGCVSVSKRQREITEYDSAVLYYIPFNYYTSVRINRESIKNNARVIIKLTDTDLIHYKTTIRSLTKIKASSGTLLHDNIRCYFSLQKGDREVFYFAISFPDEGVDVNGIYIKEVKEYLEFVNILLDEYAKK